MKTLTNRILGLVLVLALLAGFVLIPSPIDIQAEAATVSSTKLCDYIQDGVTLHCWNWSIANIKANLGLIANMGYSAIQLSPMQELKESTADKPYDNWWAVYQPISFNINTSDNHCVGTKSELIELCKEAHKYNIKVIMDVVCNHTANDGNNKLSPLVDPELLNDPNCWHDYKTNSWDYSSRYNITQYCMAGLPDLNTGNQKVQDKVLAMLKDYIDCGVDGFRFDAAKQIETPDDHSSFASDFWPTVVNGAASYAASTRGIALYNYGELLENADSNNSLHISAYTKYISVTESVWSNDVRYKLEAHNASGLQTSYFKDANADKLVLWAESHDTVGDGSSLYSSHYNLDKAWSLVASRAYTMGLYFPRCVNITDLPLDASNPNAKPVAQKMGEIAKLGWSSDLTKAINRFHNHFACQSEYLTKDTLGNMFYNERGNSGVIITNFNDGGRDINIPVYRMVDGTYVDQITGNKFYVSYGRLTGYMGDSGVAVIYNPTTVNCSHPSHGLDGYCYDCYTYVGHKSGTTCSVCGTASTRTIYFNNTSGWTNVYAYGWHDNGSIITSAWPGTKMTKVSGNLYKITLPVSATNVIFNNNNGSQSSDITISAENDTYHFDTGFWTLTDSSYGGSGTTESTTRTIYFNNSGKNWSKVNVYAWSDSGECTGTWPGKAMTKVSDNYYAYEVPTSATKIIFNNGSSQTDDLTIPTNGRNMYQSSNNTWVTYSGACTHSYSSSITTAATCTKDGVKTYTCSKCGNSYTEAVAATGHSYVSGKCSKCGAAAATGCTHSYTYKITTAATCTAAGVKTYICSLCGHSYTSAIAATGHSYTGGKCISCGAAQSGSDSTGFYLYGYINGTNYAYEENYQNLGSFKFVGGKLKATFNSDSYVGVKTSDNATWYMTNGWQGDKTSVTLYKSGSLTNGDKLFVPGNVEVTFTLTQNSNGTLTLSYTVGTCNHSFSGGVCSVCGESDPSNEIEDYYLFGYINGSNYACEKDAGNVGEYKFVNGKLTTSFATGSYVAVKCGDNSVWYMTDGWQGTTKKSVTLYESGSLSNGDKLYVPGGVQVTFTLSENSNGTLNLSYTTSGKVDSGSVTKPTFSLKYPTVSFEDVIVLNVYYAASNLQDVEEMGLVTFDGKVSSCNINNADHVVPGYAWSESDGFYVSSSAGIAAKNLGDTIYFAVYARLKDGSYCYSSLVSYSPKTYAYNQLKSGTDDMKALVVAMLNYGAKAQSYFNYNTDNLIDANLTAAQKALVKDYSSTMMNSVALPNDSKMGAMTSNGGYASRYPTISFEGVFCINYYFKPSKTPSGNITMYIWDQAAYDGAAALSKGNASKAINMTKTSSDEYMAVAEGIAAKNLDKGVYVAFCYTSGNTEYCSGVVGYSIGAYCTSQASKTGTLADLAAACAVYGYYAKQLFG